MAGVGCLAAASATPAGSAPIVTGAIASGPVLTGAETVVWAEYDRPIVAGLAPVGYVLRSGGADGTAGFRAAGPPTGRSAVLPELSASSELVGVGRRTMDLGRYGPFPTASDTFTFSPSGPPWPTSASAPSRRSTGSGCWRSRATKSPAAMRAVAR